MLGYIVLIGLQIIIGWFGEPQITQFLPGAIGGTVLMFARAVVYAVIVWACGLVFHFVLRDVGLPGAPTLVTALVCAVIGAAAVLFLPMAGVSLPRGVNPDFILLGGAIIGYLMRR